MRATALAIGLFAAALLVGCSSSEAKGYRVSGEAKFDGQPIPYGDVLFTPDGSKGNSGPQGFASIQDGKFDTAAGTGKGFAGGPTVVRVAGLDKPGGKVLCDYEYKVDLPRSDTTHNVEVPASAAPGAKRKGPEI